MSRHSQTPRRGTFRLLVLAVSVLLLGLSVALLSIGLRHTSPSAAPRPPRTFNVAAPTDTQATPTSPDPSRVSGSTRTPALPERSSAPVNRHLPTHLLANHLYIRSLGVDALDQPVTPAAGTLTPPYWPQTVGLDTRAGSLTGHSGTVLMSSHANYGARENCALHDLYSIAPFAEVVVTDAVNHVTYRQVTRLSDPWKSGGIDQSIFDATGDRRLVLVTWGGTVTNGDYDRNILYAVPVG